MLEPIPDLAQGVIGFSAIGRVSADDYETVLIPAVEAQAQGGRRLRLLYRIGPECRGYTAGALWDDTRVGIAHWRAWEKIALVSDRGWIRAAVRLFAFALPGEVRGFPDTEFAAARDWVQS